MKLKINENEANLEEGMKLSSLKEELPHPMLCRHGACQKCKVKVLSGDLGDVTEAEEKSLTAEELASGIRLLCQSTLKADTEVVTV